MSTHDQRQRPMRSRQWGASRQGTVLVAVLVALMIISVAVLGLGSRNALNQQTTADRTEGSRTFYTNEAIANMAMREFIAGVDYDADGTDGGISNDGNSANNPTINGVKGMATKAVVGTTVTITCTATSTNTQRKIVMTLAQ